MKPYIILNEKDNVATALLDIEAGYDFGDGIKTREKINIAHKIAICDIEEGEEIVKYGEVIGVATERIEKGSLVHTQNMKSILEVDKEITYNPKKYTNKVKASSIVFGGYLRENNEAGIRNEIWIIPTVGCVNKTAENLAQLAYKEIACEEVDGFYAFTHPYGCSQLGDDHNRTRDFLSSLARNPNAAGVLILGLGCENNTIEQMKQLLADIPKEKIGFLITQDCEDETAEGLRILKRLTHNAKKYKRSKLPLSLLRVGLKCGGSDAFSGITANALLGRFTDMLCSEKGSAILTEVPEMFGAENALLSRAQNKDIFDEALRLIKSWKEYYRKQNMPIDKNPSPGNIKGGITTLAEKSLGCVQKGGNAPITDVIRYASRCKKSGLSILEGPGNDIIAVSALAASGASVVLFTTGRGTPLGAPVPTIKVSSNTPLAEKKPHWIDFNAGDLAEKSSMEEVSKRFFDFVISVCNGEVKTNNEKNNFREIAILKDGVTL